jgi:hypothetical protein
VDGSQALPLELLPQFLEDAQLVHETYKKRAALAHRYLEETLKYRVEKAAA